MMISREQRFDGARDVASSAAIFPAGDRNGDASSPPPKYRSARRTISMIWRHSSPCFLQWSIIGFVPAIAACAFSSGPRAVVPGASWRHQRSAEEGGQILVVRFTECIQGDSAVTHTTYMTADCSQTLCCGTQMLSCSPHCVVLVWCMLDCS